MALVGHRNKFHHPDDRSSESNSLFLFTDKVKKKYGHLGEEVMLVELERGSNGLGLSLAGHKDRTKMAVFVCGINPNGAAYKTGSVKVGDEILEVSFLPSSNATLSCTP